MSERRCRTCECLLSRYNTGAVDLCGPCAREHPPAAAEAPSVPAHVWSDSGIQEALNALDFGRLSQLVRRRSGLRQDDLARITGLSQGYLSQLESGTRRLTHLDKSQAFLEALNVPTALRPIAAPETVNGAHRATETTSHQRTAPDPAPDLNALAADAAATSGAFADLIAPTNIDANALEELSFTLARIATDYVHAPLFPLFTELISVRDQLFSKLQGRQRPQQSRELFMLAGTTCLLLAHASQNLGDQASAMTQIRTARTCAEQADHTGLLAWTLGTAALITEWSPQGRMSLRLAEQAATLAPPGESRIRIAAIEARTAARIGDHERARTALDRMRRAMDEPPRDDDLVQYGGLLTFPRAKQDYYLGGTYTLLGEHQQAQQHAATAIEAYRTGPHEERSYGDEALAQLDLITIGIHQGDLDEALAGLHHILNLPPEMRIRQLGNAMDRLGTLVRRPELKRSRAAGELADLIRGYQVIDGGTALPSGR
ncbi:helix-turn-helix domain-containing protein [Streptomyces kanamyceticus]|uniref:helix-turn-helix domain-containing protein n=1 Tax=Streptomyces kanamyceticus TaxID=1967 RepID=UPI001CC3F92C|nr:helix-turn-helix transcriptional regulator [Streptomyces kanamyceticus]